MSMPISFIISHAKPFVSVPHAYGIPLDSVAMGSLQKHSGHSRTLQIHGAGKENSYRWPAHGAELFSEKKQDITVPRSY